MVFWEPINRLDFISSSGPALCSQISRRHAPTDQEGVPSFLHDGRLPLKPFAKIAIPLSRFCQVSCHGNEKTNVMNAFLPLA